MAESEALYVMPSLGADMTEGTVVRWLVRPGDLVHRGDIVATIDTDKAEIDAEIFQDGRIDELLVPIGERVPVGTALARLTSAGPVSAAAVSGVPVSGGPVSAAAVSGVPVSGVPVSGVPATVLSGSVVARTRPSTFSPLVRRLAADHGLDLTRLEGHGPGGTVTRGDVEGAEVRRLPGRVVVRASPRARRLAAAAGLELSGISGTGPGGAVLATDIRTVTPVTGTPPPGAPPSEGPSPEGPTASAVGATRRPRRPLADLMSRSKREIPHYYLAQDVSFAAASAWLLETNADRSAASRLLPVALVLKATALAVEQTDGFNGFWVDGEFRPADAVHLGVAIARRGGGLLAPCIHDAARLPLDELMSCLRDLVERTRSGRMRSSEMSDATVTVTALGDQGVQQVFGVIYPPQVAMIGVGAITERAWAERGMVGARPVVTLTLAADHRASDGHDGARLLARIDALLQSPNEL